MASKVVEILKSCLKHSLLVRAQAKHSVNVPNIAGPDGLQLLPLHPVALLWVLHGYEGGSSNIASGDCVV